MFYCCGVTDTGRVRDTNEDAFLIKKKIICQGQYETTLKAPFIAAAADGVAGEAHGEIASRFVLKRLAKVKPSENTDYAQKLLKIHTRLRNYGAFKSLDNMQTTLCAIAVHADNKANAVNVGDSRLYRFRAGKLKQLTTDQSLVQMLYEQGSIPHEQKINHAQKNVIFPVMGSVESEPAADITAIDGGLEIGDIIIICTDGLSDYITSGEAEEALSLPQKLVRRVARLIEIAADNGSPDNITAVAVYRQS